MINITECILHINPQANFVCWENDFSRVVYDPSHVGVKPTLAECEAAWTEIQATSEVTAPTIEEQLEALKIVVAVLAEVVNV